MVYAAPSIFGDLGRGWFLAAVASPAALYFAVQNLRRALVRDKGVIRLEEDQVVFDRFRQPLADISDVRTEHDVFLRGFWEADFIVLGFSDGTRARIPAKRMKQGFAEIAATLSSLPGSPLISA